MTRLMVGTYAGKGGAGLVPLDHDAATGRWSLGPPVATVQNASFAVPSPRHGLLYVVDEEAGTIGVVRDGEPLASVGSGGDAPCHLALASDGARLAVANYGSGSVALFDLDEDGIPVLARHWQNRGNGPNADRQEGPHAHWVGFADDGTLLCVDLGADRIVARTPEGDDEWTAYDAPPGSGPRHLASHPRLPIAYLVSELASTLTTFRTGDGTLRPEQTISTLPSSAGGDSLDSLGGAIALARDATLLHVTNRGHDSIATFAIDQQGVPHLIGHVPSGGRSPRFLLPLEHHLVVAHEESGTVAIHRLDPAGLPLPDPSLLDIPGAAFVLG